MFAYVARQPTFDRENSVFAYELLFRDSEEKLFFPIFQRTRPHQKY